MNESNCQRQNSITLGIALLIATILVLFSSENLAYCSFNATPVPLTTQERTEIFSSKTMYSDLLCVMCRYRFRVLDAFGTEAVYNDDEYVKSHPQLENHAGLGRLGLRLKQFYTLYRMYLAFVVPKYMQSSAAECTETNCNQHCVPKFKRLIVNCCFLHQISYNDCVQMLL